ncbi:hypothetical protein H5410_063142 [Solanum commersonii]|uniref:EF-hand domain-containing protein n=1 Tax=Solanum commersonii TaxID=4109 RepID=A0A9J5WEF8_SOLCO|nr:hypothetical protein H5410_063142 [Solanum commersonii]
MSWVMQVFDKNGDGSIRIEEKFGLDVATAPYFVRLVTAIGAGTEWVRNWRRSTISTTTSRKYCRGAAD